MVLVATIGKDGTPRLSPIEPLVLDGEFWLAMMWGSHKAADLARDHRVLDHVGYVRYDESTGDQYVVTWPDGGEFVRRGTSATTVGPPEPRRDVLVDEAQR